MYLLHCMTAKTQQYMVVIILTINVSNKGSPKVFFKPLKFFS